jgi:radical SAM protein with 4Fe4S-binding SPASM domain
MPGTQFDFFVQWHLTEQCNLHCRHCYQDVAVPAMSLEETIRGIDNIRDAFASWAADYDLELSPAFHFTGGEPFLREDLFDVLDYVGKCGYATAIMSNGTLITPDIARRLRQTGIGEVQVSLDGLEAVHDGIRGAGSFRRALGGLTNLVASGVATSINLTLSRLNLGELEGLVRLAGEMGVGAVTFSRLVACGSGSALGDQMLTPQELSDFYRGVRQRPSDAGVDFSSRDPLFTVSGLAGEVPETDFPIGGCAAGVFGITIAADGGIMPCRRMDMTIGNIRRDSFRELWAESPVLWALRRRDEYHDGCESCVYWAVCRGCRAVALAYARAQGREDFLGPDPQCPYYRPVL